MLFQLGDRGRSPGSRGGTMPASPEPVLLLPLWDIHSAARGHRFGAKSPEIAQALLQLRHTKIMRGHVTREEKRARRPPRDFLA